MKVNFKILLLAVLLVVIILVDQWTKHLVHTQFNWGESKSIISGFFDLTYVRNQGAAFGLFHQAPPAFRDPFFVAVPVIAIFVILFLIFKMVSDSLWSVIALSLILAGAIGNLIDRLRFGYVIDFLDFHWREIYHWPAFNVADSSIVVGVCLWFILSFKEPQAKSAKPKA